MKTTRGLLPWPARARRASSASTFTSAFTAACAAALSAVLLFAFLPAHAQAASTTRAGKGWQIGKIPAWVVNPPAPATDVPAAANAGARREQLVDIQSNYALARPQVFVRIRSTALDATALGQVSQPQVNFNPAFQTAMIHSAVVIRQGKRSDRLAQARIELMRREQQLEQQVIDGSETLLIVLKDVQVGDAVEVAYSVEGSNPIFEGRISTAMPLANDRPVELLHQRLIAPSSRALSTKSIASEVQAERSVEGNLQILRLVRHQVAAVQPEAHMPPWAQLYPFIDISEYRSWSEVDAWAQRLFVLPQPTPAPIAALAAQWRDKGLQGEALVSEALRFVQDEVRYFSVSLGESSHRPKRPQDTLAQRLGDCKDKVVLLNTLLRELGFDAKPALVSMRHNRGIRDALPSHDAFDHVITRLDLEGRSWYLDPTVTGQGLTLASRGQYPYGVALIVGAGQELQTIPEQAAALQRMEFEQLWDLSALDQRAPQFEVVLRAHGYMAERWRAGFAASGIEPLARTLSSSLARWVPGMKALNTAEVSDDREANRFELRQRFEVPEFGTYNRGFLDTDFLASELLDVLTGPSETQRRMPFYVNQPRQVDSRIVVNAMLPLTLKQMTREITDRQFRYSVRLEAQGRTATMTTRYEQRENQVLPEDLVRWREKIIQARQNSGMKLRLPLIEMAKVMPEIEKIQRQVRKSRNWREDALQNILTTNEVSRMIDTQALQRIAPSGISTTAASTTPASASSTSTSSTSAAPTFTAPLAAKILASRAIANNLSGNGVAGQADADQALLIKPDDAQALEARAVALMTNGQAEEALSTMARIAPASRSADHLSWMGLMNLYLGRASEAEPLFRDAVALSSPYGRPFALIGLYMAHEQQGKNGKTAVESDLENLDTTEFSTSLLRFMVGTLDRDSLLRRAREKPVMERLNLAEANFYIAQRLMLQGQRDEALTWFQRTLDTQALPYREYMLAQMELQRAQKAKP